MLSANDEQVVGYVASGYGTRGESLVKADIDRYKVSGEEKTRRGGKAGGERERNEAATRGSRCRDFYAEADEILEADGAVPPRQTERGTDRNVAA